MLFNSIEFILVFLPIVFLGYFYLIGKRLIVGARCWLVVASLFFYSWWNPIYLPLILLSMAVNYTIGTELGRSSDDKKVMRKKKFNKKPKIAITGLNPHCESNFKNSEEETIIMPAIKQLKLKKFNVNGPFPADTIFNKLHLKNYDVVIGMYHDQVLSPMKALFNFDAINITLGLPFIRISPDHGPNTSMLGKNLSDPKSLINALKFLDN